MAVRGADKAALLERFGWRECGSASDEMNARIACAVMKDGWVVIASADHALDLRDLLPTASTFGFALGCEVTEQVMYSRLQAWSDGQQVWSVTHDPERDPKGVEVEGDAPAELQAIRSELSALQAADGEVDYLFEAPVQLAERLCGYELGQSLDQDWIVLCGAGERAESGPRKASLRDALRAEILPLAETYGWRPDSSAPGGAYQLSRVRDGRRQELWFTWMDDGRTIFLIPVFTVRDGATAGVPFLFSAEFAPTRAGFGARLKALFRREARLDPDARVAAIISEARSQILALEAVLDGGDADPRIRLHYGDLKVLRKAAA
jgi:hypothetical protein